MSTEHEDIVAIRAEIEQLRKDVAKATRFIRQIHHHTMFQTALRFIWLAVFIGIPIAAYIFAGSFLEVFTNYLNTQVHHAMQTVLEQGAIMR